MTASVLPLANWPSSKLDRFPAFVLFFNSDLASQAEQENGKTSNILKLIKGFS